MSKNEKDYSDYIAHLSNLSNIRAILAGFTFTVITLLLTQLPDPSQTQVQIVLFILTVLVDVFAFTIYDEVMQIARSIRRSHKPPWESFPEPTLHDVLSQLSSFLWGSTVVVMFFLWNLINLALITGVVYGLFMVLAYFHSWKPAVEHWKKLRLKSED